MQYLQCDEGTNGEEDNLSDFKIGQSTDKIYREYDPPNLDCVFSSWKEGRPTVCHSWYRCIRYSFIFTVICGVVMAIISTFIIWIELNLGVICRHLNKGTFNKLPQGIQKAQLTRGVIKGMLIQSWFFLIILLVFGSKLVKKLNLLPWTLLAASIDAIFRLLLYVYRMYGRLWMPYPLYVVFMTCFLFSSYRIASHYEQPIRQRIRFAFKLGAQFYIGFPLSLVINHVVLHYFSVIPDKYKAVMASLAPALLIAPKAIARLCAEKMEGVNHPGTSVLLVVIPHAAPQMLFRILQAKLEGYWMYVVLSIVHGIESTFDKITLPLQDYILKRCCLRNQQHNSRERKPRENRLFADLAIVSMIAESSAILVSSAVIQMFRYHYGHDVKYRINNYARLLETFLFQASTGITIECLFNIIAIKVQTYFYNIPIIRVWKARKLWIFGMFLFNTIMGMLFFGKYFYGALSSKHIFDKTITRHCTNPFQMP